MRKALVVGIDSYQDCKLNCCCNDAKAVAELLSKQENGDLNFEVKCELSIKTKGELKGKIDECFSGYCDVALFYFSGHGYIDKFGGYLITPDYSKNDYGVSLQDVLNIVNISSIKNKIVIIDSCYSGYMGKINTGDANLNQISDGVTILTACRDDETAVATNNYSIFTELLIEGLKGAASDILGNITPASVYSYIDKNLGAWEQRPVFKTNISKFVSIRNVIPQVDRKIIRTLTEYFRDPNELLKLDPSYEDTNSPNYKNEMIQPYADENHVKILKNLQKLESIGLVIPEGENHMYFAAMRSKACKLTAIGKQYYKLVKENKI